MVLRTASSSGPPSIYFSTRCATISVSVSVTNLWPFFFEFLLEFQVIFDDAVVHDDDLALAVAMRMGVFFRGAAVRGPAGVAQAVDAIDGHCANGLLEIRQLAGGAANLQFARFG